MRFWGATLHFVANYEELLMPLTWTHAIPIYWWISLMVWSDLFTLGCSSLVGRERLVTIAGIPRCNGIPLVWRHVAMLCAYVLDTHARPPTTRRKRRRILGWVWLLQSRQPMLLPSSATAPQAAACMGYRVRNNFQLVMAPPLYV